VGPVEDLPCYPEWVACPIKKRDGVRSLNHDGDGIDFDTTGALVRNPY